MTRYGSKELARSFRTVRTNTIETARDIPEEEYGYRPSPECRSVGELLTHIALIYRFQHRVNGVDRLSTMESVDFQAVFAALKAEEEKTRTKDEIIALLEREGEVWATFLDGLSDELLCEVVTFPPGATPPVKTRFELILSVKEHEMHHRAQLMVYERMLGIVPHLTRQRAARMAERAKAAGA